MPTTHRAPKVPIDGRVLAVSKRLADAHAHVKTLKRELRGSEGDVRRALAELRRLTTPAARQARRGVSFRPATNGNG